MLSDGSGFCSAQCQVNISSVVRDSTTVWHPVCLASTGDELRLFLCWSKHAILYYCKNVV